MAETEALEQLQHLPEEVEAGSTVAEQLGQLPDDDEQCKPVRMGWDRKLGMNPNRPAPAST